MVGFDFFFSQFELISILQLRILCHFKSFQHHLVAKRSSPNIRNHWKIFRFDLFSGKSRKYPSRTRHTNPKRTFKPFVTFATTKHPGTDNAHTSSALCTHTHLQDRLHGWWRVLVAAQVDHDPGDIAQEGDGDGGTDESEQGIDHTQTNHIVSALWAIT